VARALSITAWRPLRLRQKLKVAHPEGTLIKAEGRSLSPERTLFKARRAALIELERKET